MIDAKKRASGPRLSRENTAQEVADILEVDEHTIRRWCNTKKGEKCPATRKRDGTLRLNEAEVVAWMKRTKHTGREGRPASVNTPTLEAARLRKENALADRYEVAVAKERGLLLDAAEVEHQVAGMGAEVRTGMENLMQQLTALALSHGLPHEAAPEFERQGGEMVAAILRRLSDAGATNN